MNEEPTQVGVAPLADAEQLRFATGRMLAVHEAEPSWKIARGREGAAIVHGRAQGRGRGRYRPDAWDRHQTTRRLVGAGARNEL